MDKHPNGLLGREKFRLVTFIFGIIGARTMQKIRRVGGRSNTLSVLFIGT